MKKIKLGDVLDVKRGASLSGQFYSNKGNYIRLTLGNFNYPNGGFKLNTAKDDLFFVGDVKPEFIMKKGDIITPLTEQVYGLLGETATIPEDDLFIQSGDIGLIIPNPDEVDNRFVYYLVSSAIVRKQLGAAAQQTKIRHTSPEKIKDCIAFLPKMDQQKRISMLMDNINEKIALNNKIISELESMAKTLYDYWFLQFDFPDENGKPYKSYGGKMVYNEELNREIPEQWEVVEIDSLIDVKDGTHDSPKYVKKGKYLITSKHLLSTGLDYVNANKISEDDFNSINKRSKVDNGDILFSMIGALGIVYRVNEEVIDFAIKNVALYKASQLPFIQEYLEQTLTSVLMDVYVTRCNAGSIQKFISLGQLRKMPIVYNKEILELYSKKVKTFFLEMDILKNENRDLASLRDFLLPMLMNGQVTFKDAAEAHND